MSDLKIIHGDCREKLAEVDSGSIHCCVTSPPYYGLRDYGVDGQIGLEQTPEEYIAELVTVFHEVRRTLRDDGTLWINIGDSYWGGKGQSGSQGMEFQQMRVKTGVSFSSPAAHVGGNGKTRPTDKKHESIKAKDLIGIPWMLAFALRADGWYLRQDIIWAKPNPMPESVIDRCTKSHEYVFLLSKSASYFYDNLAVMEAAAYDGRKDTMMKGSAKFQDGKFLANGKPNSFHANGHERWQKNDVGDFVRNRRSVWSVATKPYADAHFATYPPALIKPCILAGCPVDGTVLDPFGGSGTTGKVALELGRSAVLIELNPDYLKFIEKRSNVNLPLFV